MNTILFRHQLHATCSPCIALNLEISGLGICSPDNIVCSTGKESRGLTSCSGISCVCDLQKLQNTALITVDLKLQQTAVSFDNLASNQIRYHCYQFSDVITS